MGAGVLGPGSTAPWTHWAMILSLVATDSPRLARCAEALLRGDRVFGDDAAVQIAFVQLDSERLELRLRDADPATSVALHLEVKPIWPALESRHLQRRLDHSRTTMVIPGDWIKIISATRISVELFNCRIFSFRPRSRNGWASKEVDGLSNQA